MSKFSFNPIRSFPQAERAFYWVSIPKVTVDPRSFRECSVALGQFLVPKLDSKGRLLAFLAREGYINTERDMFNKNVTLIGFNMHDLERVVERVVSSGQVFDPAEPAEFFDAFTANLRQYLGIPNVTTKTESGLGVTLEVAGKPKVAEVEATVERGIDLATLRNGSRIASIIVTTTMMNLRQLFSTNFVAFINLVQKCQDPRHEYWGNSRNILIQFALIGQDGTVHPSVKDVVFSAVQGEGLRMTLKSPIAEDSV